MDCSKNEKYKPVSLINMSAKHLNKILSNQIQICIENTL